MIFIEYWVNKIIDFFSQPDTDYVNYDYEDEFYLEDILHYSYGATWKTLEAKIQELPSQETASERGVMGGLVNLFSPAYNKATERGIVIVNISQCLTGMVEMGLYETGLHLLDAGVISGYDSTVEALITKLMFLLGHGKSDKEIRELMNQPIAGEFTKA